MNLYLDSSALAKRYLSELGTFDVREMIGRAEVTAASLVTRAEVSAAFARAVRTGAITSTEGEEAQDAFRADWSEYFALHVSHKIVKSAEDLVWKHDLRGFDAIQLSSVLRWKKSQGKTIIFATFDLQLWQASQNYPLVPWPDDLPALLESWRESRN